MSNDHKAKIEKQVEGWGYKDKLIRQPEFEELIKAALADLIEQERQNQQQLPATEVVESFTANAKQSRGNYYRVQSAYKDALNHWEKALDVDARFLRINRKVNIESVVTRLFTTLAIGFAVMAVYYLANLWQIPMPLLRIPV